MIYLDTHVIVWLYAGLEEKFSQTVKKIMNENETLISPIVRLELQYLHQLERIDQPADEVIGDISKRFGTRICEKDFNAVVSQALSHTWTRDPFDRLIVANAAIDDSILISKDKNILENYDQARW